MKWLYHALFLSLGFVIAPLTALGAEPKEPLDRVPGNVAFLAHAKGGALWNHPTVVALRKQYEKDLPGYLKDFEGMAGFKLEEIDSVTFCYPKIDPQNDGQRLFVAQFKMTKPVNKATVFKSLRAEKQPKDVQYIQLQEAMALFFDGERQFSIMHDSFAKDFPSWGEKAVKGAMTEAIDRAKQPKSLVTIGFDTTQFPKELLDEAPNEIKPFIPLLTAKMIIGHIEWDKDIELHGKIIFDNKEKAIDGDRAFQLLIKVINDQLDEVVKRGADSPEVKPFIPVIDKFKKVTTETKLPAPSGDTLVGKMTFPGDAEFWKPLPGLVVKTKEAAIVAQSQNNLKQLALAMHNYESATNSLPPAAICDKKGKPLLSWRVAILPYIEQDNLYKLFKLDEPWDSEHNLKLAKSINIKIYQLPYGDTKLGYTHYQLFTGKQAIFDTLASRTFAKIADGTSNTMMMVEAKEPVFWTKPDDLVYNPDKPLGKLLYFHNGKCNVAMADGSVRSLKNTITDAVLKLLIEADDGQVIPDLDK